MAAPSRELLHGSRHCKESTFGLHGACQKVPTCPRHHCRSADEETEPVLPSARHTGDSPKSAFTVMPEWCEKILHSGKVWEVRGEPCRKHLHERVCIARSGSGLLVGEATIRESRRVTMEELESHHDLHLIDDLSILRYPQLFVWVLEDVQAYATPVPYHRPRGCVNWVNLAPDAARGQRATPKPAASKRQPQCANDRCEFGHRKCSTRGKPHWCPKSLTHYDHCMFCDAQAFQAALRYYSGRQVRAALARLAKADLERHQKAIDRIEEMAGPRVAARFCPRNRGGSKKRSQLAWRSALALRQSALRWTRQEKTAFAAQQHSQASRLKRKFPSLYGEESRDELLWMSSRAFAFRTWCLEDSWRLCSSCGRMLPQAFRAQHAKSTASSSPEQPACTYCKSDGASSYWAPTPNDIPRRLRKLTPAIVEALRPFDLHTGGAFRAPNGYLVHTDMVRFSFKTASVEDNLAKLSRKEQRRGIKALCYLLSTDASSYGAFWKLHEQFLARRASAIARGETWSGAPVKRLPANFIETVGLECALWPHLYWTTDMTETYVRSRDSRRLQRSRRAGEDVDEGEPEPTADRRHSAKASYLAKTHSAVIGYNSDSQLLHFVYDVWLFTTIGGAKNSAKTGIREALVAKPYSPEVWRTYHLALVDAQRQLGWPGLFITVAPYEWSFPYHYWLEDELEKALSARLHMPVSETLHLAHVLSQAVKGLLTGSNEGLRPGREHVFAATHGRGGVRYWVARLEFQDGKRKRGVFKEAQSYHGRGTIHVHILLWLDNMQQMNLASCIRADIPEEPEMRDLVVGSQLDWVSSGWPLRNEATEVCESDGRLRLHHPKSAFDRHCRAYLPDVLAALRCHVDVLASDGRAMVLKYCASPMACET